MDSSSTRQPSALVRGLQRCAVLQTDKFNSSILTVNNQVSDASLATG
jgi:hypothetical protein